MKKLFLVTFILCLFVQLGFSQANPRGEASVELSGGKITIEYGRPSLKGRNIENMISAGAQWRMGADASTTLTTQVNLNFDHQQITKGEYVLRAKFLGDLKWHLLIHDKNKAKVAEVPLIFEKNPKNNDIMTIRVEGKEKSGTFTLEWGKLRLSANFKAS